MDQAQLVERAKSLIDDLARTPRFAGSAEEARARARCRAELEQAGYSCREIPFEYSQWLGRWGMPVLGILVAVVFIFLAHVALTGSRFSGVSVLLILWFLSELTSIPTRRGWVLTFPWSRATAVNLEATRGEPRVWLVAHLDSKSQTMPMLLRIAGSVSLQLAGLLVFIVAPIIAPGSHAPQLLAAAQGFAVFGAIAVGLCFVRSASAGAVDNATGVAAAILAAQSRNGPPSLGVLITSGEELGLAGAIAWARARADGRSEQLAILNCDTIDDRGDFRCMYSPPKSERLITAARNQAQRNGLPVRISRLIPGIMADSMAFADSTRWSAITLSRGNLSTLARVHTRGDNSSKLTGEGVANASALLSAMARELS